MVAGMNKVTVKFSQCFHFDLLELELKTKSLQPVVLLCAQRAVLQLKAQRQLEEALESRLRRMQPSVQTAAPVSSDSVRSDDTNLTAGECTAALNLR